MSDTYYEYTFEFYIGSNLFYKASKLREELKNILKSNHSESITRINQITREKEEIKLENDEVPKRPLYSFSIGLIENKKMMRIIMMRVIRIRKEACQKKKEV